MVDRDVLGRFRQRGERACQASSARWHFRNTPQLRAFPFSAVHTDNGIAFVLESFDRSFGEMRQMGRFAG